MAAPPKTIRWITGHEFDFAFKANGHIECLTCNEVWCEHTAKCTVQGWDNEALFPEDSELTEELDLQVPMFPSSNQWTQVKLLRDTQWGPERFKVIWNWEPVTDGMFLCFLSAGEGRQVIRTVLIDYMMADPNRQTECKAAHHSFEAEMRWQKETAVHRMRTAQLWSVYTTGQCLHCVSNTGVDDDLIPEKQGNNVWS